MIFSAVVAGLIAGIIPPVIGITLIVREVYMALVTAALVLRGKGVLEVRYLGKVATFGVYSSIGWFYMAEIPFLEWLTRPLAWGVGVFSLILYWITAFQYTGDARRVMSQLESGPVPEES
jgi:phosphatidylglycerophosphate synthase